MICWKRRGEDHAHDTKRARQRHIRGVLVGQVLEIGCKNRPSHANADWQAVTVAKALQDRRLTDRPVKVEGSILSILLVQSPLVAFSVLPAILQRLQFNRPSCIQTAVYPTKVGVYSLVC